MKKQEVQMSVAGQTLSVVNPRRASYGRSMHRFWTVTRASGEKFIIMGGYGMFRVFRYVSNKASDYVEAGILAELKRLDAAFEYIALSPTASDRAAPGSS
jgi:hypothetical protein